MVGLNIFFPPPQSSTRQSNGNAVADACCAGVFVFLSKENITPYTKQLLLKNPS